MKFKNIVLALLLLIVPPIFCSLSFVSTDHILEYIQKIVPKNPVILEAGGHHGEDTIRMKARWPQSTMHVFEPLPTSFVKLLERTQHVPGVYRYPYALTTYSGKTKFYLNPNNDGASSIGYPVSWNEDEFIKQPLEVECITLDDWSDKNSVTHIDFMWLDMEGHELYALQNASKILSSVKVIYTEIGFVAVREGSCLYKDLKIFLEQKGFTEVWKSADSGRIGDALFIKK